MSDAVDRYIERISEGFDYNLRGIQFAIDCANGAALAAAPRMLQSLGAEVEAFGTDPDGMNINDGCGATHPGFLAERAEGRIGLSFDGDADRLIAIDEDGVPADGDVLMAIFANYLKENRRLKGDLVVATVMSQPGIS